MSELPPHDALRHAARLAASMGPALLPVGHAQLLEALAATGAAVFHAAAGSVALLDEETEELVFVAAVGLGASGIVGVRLPVSRGIAGSVMGSGEVIAVGDVTADPRFARDVAEQSGYVPKTILAAPLETERRALGVLQVLDAHGGTPPPSEDLQLLSVFARQAALSVEGVAVFSDLGRVLLETLAATAEGEAFGPALRVLALDATKPTAELAGLAAAFAELDGLGQREREAALALVEQFLPYRASQDGIALRPAWSSAFDPTHLPTVSALPLPAPITAAWAWGGATGAGVKVAIVDSGIDASHPSVGVVAGGVAMETDQSAPDGVRAVEGTHDDRYGHGTACAGIIRRIAPECQLYSVRVLGTNLRGRSSTFAAGVRWSLDHGMDVVNLSLSTKKHDYFAMFHKLTDEAYFQHRMLICAANNVPGPTYPSEYASVFSVAAHDDQDPLGFDYNPMPPVEFGAPGLDVEVPWLGGTTMRVSGNSFAAAHITGVVTLILSKYVGLTPFQMKTILHATARNASRPTGR